MSSFTTPRQSDSAKPKESRRQRVDKLRPLAEERHARNLRERCRGHMGKAPIGLVALLVGDHRNFKFTLNPAPKSGTQLWAVLEQSSGNTEPFKRFDGKPVEESFTAL